MSVKVTPTVNEYKREKDGSPMEATLVSMNGSWHLLWPDGRETNLQKSSAPTQNHGYAVETIINMLRPPPLLQTRSQLWESMCDRTPIRYTYNGKEISGVVSNIQAEDGSGYKFNVTLSTKQQFFVNFQKGK